MQLANSNLKEAKISPDLQKDIEKIRSGRGL